VAPFRVLICSVPMPLIPHMQAVDGLFMAVRRGVAEQIRFDEKTFDGFHCYDIDFSYSAHLAGFRVAVAADLPVLHHSPGISMRHGSTTRSASWKSTASGFPRSSADPLSPRSWAPRRKRKCSRS
jgi:GT2 family glycosyltransferase